MLRSLVSRSEVKTRRIEGLCSKLLACFQLDPNSNTLIFLVCLMHSICMQDTKLELIQCNKALQVCTVCTYIFRTITDVHYTLVPCTRGKAASSLHGHLALLLFITWGRRDV